MLPSCTALSICSGQRHRLRGPGRIPTLSASCIGCLHCLRVLSSAPRATMSGEAANRKHGSALVFSRSRCNVDPISAGTGEPAGGLSKNHVEANQRHPCCGRSCGWPLVRLRLWNSDSHGPAAARQFESRQLRHTSKAVQRLKRLSSCNRSAVAHMNRLSAGGLRSPKGAGEDSRSEAACVRRVGTSVGLGFACSFHRHAEATQGHARYTVLGSRPATLSRHGRTCRRSPLYCLGLRRGV